MNNKEHSKDELLMYILVNEELLEIPVMIGKIGAQIGHVVGDYVDSIKTYEAKHDKCGDIVSLDGRIDYNDLDNYREWKADNIKKIVLKAPKSMLDGLENKYWSVRDNGLTKIEPNTLTAVCLGVNTREEFIKKIPKLKRLRIL